MFWLLLFFWLLLRRKLWLFFIIAWNGFDDISGRIISGFGNVGSFGSFGWFGGFGRFDRFGKFDRFDRFDRFDKFGKFGWFGWFGRFGRFGRFGFSRFFISWWFDSESWMASLLLKPGRDSIKNLLGLNSNLFL